MYRNEASCFRSDSYTIPSEKYSVTERNPYLSQYYHIWKRYLSSITEDVSVTQSKWTELVYQLLSWEVGTYILSEPVLKIPWKR